METCFADMKARVTGEERRSARPKDLQVGMRGGAGGLIFNS